MPITCIPSSTLGPVQLDTDVPLKYLRSTCARHDLLCGTHFKNIRSAPNIQEQHNCCLMRCLRMCFSRTGCANEQEPILKGACCGFLLLLCPHRHRHGQKEVNYIWSRPFLLARQLARSSHSECHGRMWVTGMVVTLHRKKDDTCTCRSAIIRVGEGSFSFVAPLGFLCKTVGQKQSC